METFIDFGPYVLNNTRHDHIRGAQGRLFLRVKVLTEEEFAQEEYPADVHTIAELEQTFGGLKGHLQHSVKEALVPFDLTPWAHLPKDTHLLIVSGFKFDPGQNYKMPASVTKKSPH